MSSIVKVACTLLLLPHSSVAVNVTVAEPVVPQSSLKPVKSLLQITPLHASVAVAPPLLSNQVFNASKLPMPSHSTVWSEAAVTSGAVTSCTVTICSHMDSFPQ